MIDLSKKLTDLEKQLADIQEKIKHQKQLEQKEKIKERNKIIIILGTELLKINDKDIINKLKDTMTEKNKASLDEYFS